MTFKELFLTRESIRSQEAQQHFFPEYQIRSPRFRNDITNPKNFVYHVTNRKYLKSIMRYGLMPMVGEMVNTFYDDEEQEELTELIFFSDIPKTHYASPPFEKATLDDIIVCLVHKIDNDDLMHNGMVKSLSTIKNK